MGSACTRDVICTKCTRCLQMLARKGLLVSCRKRPSSYFFLSNVWDLATLKKFIAKQQGKIMNSSEKVK